MSTPSRWARVTTLFHRAMERPPEQRIAFARAHEGDSDIAREVESLLAAEPLAHGFLSGSPVNGTEVATKGLPPGSHLGHFEILGLLGAGGMGEVYRARDTRLERTVAIKVLPRERATHPGSRERFEREARAISQLAHPHVCTLHDVGIGQVADTEVRYLVMEFVDGETLAARLQRGALPVAQALSVGIEMLDALAAAHAVGIVHRDLKPGNVMLTKSGVKLLDFGLAQLLPTNGSHRRDVAHAHQPLTTEGVLVGTVQYMAPEQLRGEATDARTDLFAFGAVLYEMITGARAFAAPSPAAIAAAILERDPPALGSHAIPPDLERVVATCLAKDPDDRWQRARDVWRELLWIRDGDTRKRAVGWQQSRRWWLAAAGVLVVVAVAVAVAVNTTSRSTPAPPAPRVVFTIAPPDGTTFPRASAEIAISPDGSRLVFVALSIDGTRRLWLRRLDSTESRPIKGTEGAAFPFWSPDGRLIGFFAHSARLVRIDADGSARQELADVIVPRGGTWAHGQILFSSDTVLHRVAEDGGVVTQVTTLDAARRERRHSWPAFLPDGNRFLYASLPGDGGEPALLLKSLDSTTTARVLAGATHFVVAGDRLLSLNNRTLVAQTIDVSGQGVSGEPVPLASGVGVDVRWALGAFAASGPSVLAYRIVGDQSRLRWFDRGGRTQEASRENADYQHPWLSPDETRLAVEKTDSTTGRHTVWILDLRRDVTTRLLVDSSGAHGPIWSPDGRTLLFSSNRLGGTDIYSMPADGNGEQTLVRNHPHRVLLLPTDWSPDGRHLLYIERGDVWALPMDRRDQPRPFVNTNANEIQARFSPDGRWVAYTSDESGVPEVYVRRFPGGEGTWRVSTDGGAQAQWRGDGKELFFLAADGQLMAADITSNQTTFVTAPAHALFDTGIRGLFVDRRNHYVATKDGQRFLFNLTPEEDVAAPITVVLNWDVRQ